MDPLDVAVIQLVARAGLILGDQVGERAFAGDPEASVRRGHDAVLRRLVARGYLETRPVAFAVSGARLDRAPGAAARLGKVAFAKGYLVTRRASEELNLALPAPPREALVDHHVKTLDALARVERRERARGSEVLGFKMEAQLIREGFKGRVFDGPRPQILPRFPDAILSVRRADGSAAQINVEYVSSKYTDTMIREKAEAFSGPVVWAVSNPETGARVAAITGEEPLVV